MFLNKILINYEVIISGERLHRTLVFALVHLVIINWTVSYLFFLYQIQYIRLKQN